MAGLRIMPVWLWGLLLLTGVLGDLDAQVMPTPQMDSSAEVFADGPVRSVHIQISEENMAVLRRYRWRKGENPDDRPEVPCTIREGSAVFTNVAVHLKGAAGSFRTIDSKPGLTLKFDKLAKDQLFHGLKKISLNNAVQDPTFLAEKLCRELYAKAGVPVPRADYATVELNGRRLGLYVLTEGWDKQFLRRHFKNTSGNFYDPVQGFDITKTLRVASGEHPEDQSELKAAAKAAADPDPAVRLAALEKLVDLDRFLSLLAMDVMLWNWDGYGLNKNNYRVFHDLDTGRLVFLPHGLDQMFWRPDGPIVTGRNGCIARGIMGTDEGRQRYLDHLKRLRSQVFVLEAVTNRLNELAARIRPSVSQPGLASLLGNVQFERSVNLLRSRIVQRSGSIDEQLQGLRNVLRVATHETVPLKDWKPRIVQGNGELERTDSPDALHIAVKGNAEAMWLTTVWLEDGSYRLEGRIKTRGVVADSGRAVPGVGLRVWSHRKVTDGTHWGWFPYHESRDLHRRGEVVSSNCAPVRLVGTRDWTPVTYDIELRQPMADLEVRCEFSGLEGEAWFDLNSLRITRLTDSQP